MQLPIIGVKEFNPTAPQGQRLAEEQTVILSLLTELMGMTTSIEHHPNGAPYLPDHPDIHLSLSHSSGIVAIALSDRTSPIGIDIEMKSEQAARLLPRYSSLEERRILSAAGLPPVVLWSAKEAVYKSYDGAIKEGVHAGIQLIEAQPTRLTLLAHHDKGINPISHAFILSPTAPTLVVATETKLTQPVPVTYIRR